MTCYGSADSRLGRDRTGLWSCYGMGSSVVREAAGSVGPFGICHVELRLVGVFTPLGRLSRDCSTLRSASSSTSLAVLARSVLLRSWCRRARSARTGSLTHMATTRTSTAWTMAPPHLYRVQLYTVQATATAKASVATLRATPPRAVLGDMERCHHASFKRMLSGKLRQFWPRDDE